MRWGIFSDVHANLEACQAVIKAYQGQRIDSYLCLGDVVGYGADPLKCIKLVRDIAQVTIAGNHDWACCNLFPTEYFNPWARQAISWTRKIIGSAEIDFLSSLNLYYEGEDFSAVHGTLDAPQDFKYLFDFFQARDNFRLMPKTLCFLGHTHQAGVFIEEREGRIVWQNQETIKLQNGCRYIVNVGSVGQPRDATTLAGFCIYDSAERKIFIKRTAYDIKSAQKKIVAAGLPSFLAARLSQGR